MLEDTIHVIQMLPNELMGPSVLWNNLIVLIIRADVLTIQADVWLVCSKGTQNGSGLWQGFPKSSGYIPSCAVGFIPSRRPSDIDIIHEGCCNVGHLVLYDELNIPLQDLDRICSSHGKSSEM